MELKDRLKNLRESRNLTQSELAKKTGITARQIQNYEMGTSRPTITSAKKLAVVFECPLDELLGYDGMLVADAKEKGGAKAARDIDSLISDVEGLFAGGELSDEDKDALMSAFSKAYFKSKEENKKYTPKKYRKQNT